MSTITIRRPAMSLLLMSKTPNPEPAGSRTCSRRGSFYNPRMPSRSLERREFIDCLGGATLGAWLSRTEGAERPGLSLTAAAIEAGQPPPAGPAWCDRPMRWAQLTLVENDP